MSEVVLVVAAHADDEALGCGGTIARHAQTGDTVHLVFVADGVTSRNPAAHDDLLQRQSATERAAAILGAASVEFLGFPDNRLDTVALLDIVQRIEPIIARLRPTVIYTHHFGDLNVDHRQTHAAVMTACRPLPGSTVREIYTFEVLSSTEWASAGLAPFLPDHFVDITVFLKHKLEALEAYSMEMRESPHSRCMAHVEALARHRGNSVGREAAEAFMTVRVIR